MSDQYEIRREAERLFVANNVTNGALYPYGFGFLSKEDQRPWMEKAAVNLSKAPSKQEGSDKKS